MYQRNVLMAVYARLALWIGAVVFVAWVLLGTNVVNAFFTFCLSGHVPGTDMILSPNAVILVATGCLLLFFGTVIIRIYARHIRRQIGPVWKAEGRPAAALAVAAPETARHDRRRNIGVSRTMRGRLVLAVWRQYGSARAVEARLKIADALQSLAHALLVASARALIITLIGAGIAYRQLVGLARYTGGQAVSVWRFAEPYLWKFDGWLERHVQVLVTSVANRLQKSWLAYSVQEILDSYKKPSASLQPRPMGEEQQTATDQPG